MLRHTLNEVMGSRLMKFLDFALTVLITLVALALLFETFDIHFLHGHQ